MSSKPSPIKTPYENKNEFGYQSQDPNNPYVKAVMDSPTQVDPGVARRTDLAEQESENRWNNAFTSGLPMHVRMQMQGAEQRQIQAQGAAESQQAEYERNQQELQKRALLLPQLVQTGSSGYNSQIPGSNGTAGSAIAAGGAIATQAIIAA
jgi:hypothetical protein